MCEKCKELDFEISLCEQLKLKTQEPLFVEALEALVESYRKERLALHVEEAVGHE